MRPFKVFLLCLCVSLVSGYTALQLAAPPTELPLGAVTLPPKLIFEDDGELIVWGGWRTRDEYVAHGDVAVEIRCNMELQLCTEAVAGLLRHDEGEDLEAQAYLLNITSWVPDKVEAAGLVSDCLIRQVTINPEANTAVLRWSPKPGCNGGTGQADLVGDPV